MTFPAAEGVRVDWESVPAPVRRGIERICGSGVVAAVTQPGGFSPGVAARLACADGSRWFVKAVSGEVNERSPQLHRREAQVLEALDPLIAAGRLPAPRLRGALDEPPWMALVLEDVDGRHPALPWQDGELGGVLTAVDRLAESLTPAPVESEAVGDLFATEFTGWRDLAGSGDLARLGGWERENIGRLARIEQTWAELASGDTLLHTDLRADNLLVTRDGVVVVDWPYACRGAAFVDLVLLAPSVAMQGGPPPGDLIGRTRAGRAASPEALTAVVCAMAGYLTARSLLPPPPGIPTVREFQAAQAAIARRWLAELLDS